MTGKSMKKRADRSRFPALSAERTHRQWIRDVRTRPVPGSAPGRSAAAEQAAYLHCQGRAESPAES